MFRTQKIMLSFIAPCIIYLPFRIVIEVDFFYIEINIL